ncbi:MULTISPECIES: alpha/beta fold hydrolase [Acinetobacter]|nr:MULTISPECIES: alpha/beta hydrolase [Acinetobacter]HEN9520211.1 alpha/beta hydrolase [Acinetobacter baumannii]ENW51801.1 hypothetical protein F917_01634 [Acinetobacter baumannii NIPH 67]MZY05519.1 alpha/beta fold hydrolase [Acinetobacter pittii]PNW15986.1 alpha/beta hydrolase [Acinetobacter sp. AKBS16]WPP57323.1 alpha/beta hydrolase [Acinetobacter pittii]
MKYFVLKSENHRLNEKMRTALRGNYIELSDGVTHYELLGPENGQLIVFVGGLTVPLFYWDKIISILHIAGFRTLTYSSYGRGYSDRIRNTSYDDTLFIRQISELIKALALADGFHIVGASMGALVAMGYVNQNADAISSLTVAGPAGLAKKPIALRLLQSSNLLAGVIAKNFGSKWLSLHESNDLGDQTHAAVLSNMLLDAYRFEGSLHAVFDTVQHFGLFNRAALYQRMSELKIPTMLIWGKEDRVTPIDSLENACLLLQPKQCHVLDCGHMVPFERSNEVARFIQLFVNNL